MKNNAPTPLTMSVLQTTLNIQLGCAELGFDWPEVAPVFAKVLEEIEEVKAEVYVKHQQQEKIQDEIGDLLFSVVNLSRHLGVNPDIALIKANEKFIKRFTVVEQFAAEQNTELTGLNSDALELLWQKAKKILINAEQ